MFMLKKILSRQGDEERKVILFGSTIDGSNIFYDGVVQGLIKKGWNVHLVSGEGPVAPRILGSSSGVHVINMRRTISIYYDFISLLKWIGLLIKLRPSILVVGTPKASLLGVLAGRLTGVSKIVYILHGLRSETKMGFSHRVLLGAERTTLRLSHHKVAVSKSLKEAVGSVHPKHSDDIQVLGYGSMNGVDLNHFLPLRDERKREIRNELAIPSGAFVLGFVGRFSKDKGGDLLIELMKSDSANELGLHLLVIGNMEDQDLTDQLRRLSEIGVATVAGWTPTPEVPLSAVDLLVHPTRREGLGMVLLEAQAMQIPVLTNEVTGTVDAVKSGVGGLFAATDSLASWIEKITYLKNSPSERKEMGVKGRAYVAERFDRNVVSNRFIEYISNL